jgi:hypothetical protein
MGGWEQWATRQLRIRALGATGPTDVLPVPLVPDGRTIRRDIRSQPGQKSTAIITPGYECIEALNAKLRRARVSRASCEQSRPIYRRHSPLLVALTH